MRKRALFVSLSGFIFVTGILATLLLVYSETRRINALSESPEMQSLRLQAEILNFSMNVHEWGQKNYDPTMVPELRSQAEDILHLTYRAGILQHLNNSKSDIPTLAHTIHNTFRRLQYSYDMALVDTVIHSVGRIKDENQNLKDAQIDHHSNEWRAYMHNILMLFIACSLGGMGLMLLFVHARRRLDRSLYDLDRKGRAIEASQDGVALTDKNGHFTYVNKAMCSIFGFETSEELIGKSWEILHDSLENSRIAGEAIPTVLSTGSWHGLAVGKRHDGSLFEQELSLTKFDGGIIGISRDVSQQMASQRSVEILSSAINAADEAIAILDRDNMALYANNAVFRLFGANGLDALSDAAQREWSEHIADLRGSHGPSLVEGEFELTDGQVLSLSLSLSTLPGGSVLMIVRDISARKAAENEMESLKHQFYQAQKMEALGRMAGGMAHDFNNILAAIIGNAEFLREDLKKNSEQYGFAERIFEAGQEARGVIDQILTYARRHEVQTGSFDVRTAMGETKSIVEGLLPAGTDIRWDLGDMRLSVEGNASQIKQCIINLCANARDAMSKTEGALRLTVEPFDGTHKHEKVARRRCEERRLITVLEEARNDEHIVASVGCLAAGKSYVAIGVHDNGSGIDPDSMERIFEPFFTTKAIHEGTGLGLSAVQGIVLNHNGVVIVDTIPGSGTSMYLILPAAAPVLRVVENTEKPSEKVEDARCIVIVDDQPKVLDVAVRLVQRMGYQTKGFLSAREALDYLDTAQKGQILCVVTDQTMPEISGLDLARELQRSNEAIPVIVMSGYSSERLETLHRDLTNIKGVLRKPLVRQDLAMLLKNCLTQGQDKPGQTG